MKALLQRLGLVIAGCALAACGGGGDGGGSGGSAPTATATITSQNAPTITGAVLAATTETGDLGDLGGFAAPGGTANASASPSGPTAEAQFGPEVIPCEVSGNISFEGNIADPNTLTAGDSFTFAFNNCDEGNGDLLTGSFDFVIRSFTGDFSNGLFALTIDMTVSDLRFGDGAGLATVDGDFSIAMDTTDSPSTTITISGDALTIDAGNENAALADFSTTVTADPTAGTSSIEYSGFLMSSSFDGEVSFDVTSPLVFDSSGIPSSGELVITGAGGATITATVLGAGEVELDIDTDGDGAIDEVVMIGWQELQG